MDSLKRRLPETVTELTEPQSRRTDDGDSPSEIKDPLVEKGFQLYQEAEQSGFTKKPALVKSLKYFVRAAENGADEANQWIKSFLGSLSALPANVVLPDHLVRIMKWLTEATTAEKQICNVARSMFRKMADGKSSIPEDKIDECATRLLVSGGSEDGEMVKSSKILRGSVKRLLQETAAKSGIQEITEEHFCDAAIAFVKGDVQTPSLLVMQQLTDEQVEDFNQSNLVRKVYEYPWQTLQYLKMNVLKQIERKGIKWIWSSFPTKQFYLLLIAYILPMLTVNFVVSTIATVLFYSAFTAMIFATLQIVLTSEKSFLMLEYATIFQYFSEGDAKISLKRPRIQFMKHAIGPYIAFLVSLATLIVTMGLAHRQVVFNELLSVICFIFVVGIFLEYELSKSPLTLFLIMSRTFAWFYVILALLQTFFPIPDFVFFASNELFSVPIFPTVWLEVNLISLVQIPVQLSVIVYSLYRYSWKNFVSGLGPIMLLFCWGVLCRNFLYLSSPRYLALAAGSVFVVIAMIPFLPLLFLLSPGFFLFYYGVSQPFFISLSVVIIISLILLFTAVNFKHIKETKWLNIPLDYIFAFQILLSILFIFVGSTMYAGMHKPGSLPTVTPEQYVNTCIPNQDGNSNSVQTEINCYHLKGQVFQANGIIVSVSMFSIVDSRELALKSLPSPVKTALTCLFGSSKPMCGTAQDSPTCVYTGCNFQRSLEYTFDIELRLNLTHNGSYIPLPATLLAGNSFLNTVVKLQSGTYLEFNSTFVSGMGSTHVTLQASSLMPYNQTGIDMGNLRQNEERNSLFSRFVRSLKKTFYLLLEILFGYTRPATDLD